LTGGTEQRFALLSTTRWMVPLALVLGLVGAAVARTLNGRLLFGGGTAIVGALWAMSRVRRPTLAVGETGYRVLERGRERLKVEFSEVKTVRAVPAQEAMYVDCGDPSRNLLLPSRHGYGFRFEKQAELYVLLAKRLDGRIEVVDALVAPDPPKEKKKKKE
jgi:hypothetical protein